MILYMPLQVCCFSRYYFRCAAVADEAYGWGYGDGYGAGAASVDITSDNDSVYAAGVASVDVDNLQLMKLTDGVMVMVTVQVLLQ